MRSYTVKSTLIMTTIDIVFMSTLCYVLGLLLRLIPDATGEYWKLAGLCYGIKTAIWLLLRIPLLLPIDRWKRRGMPPEDDDPALIRSIYYFPYDFSVFYGALIFCFFGALVSILVFMDGPVQIQREMLLPGMMFAAAAGFGAVAIGVPVNLLLTAKFSQRLSERKVERFSQIPGKKLSLQTKVATVAIALGCAPSLLLFSIQGFMQHDGLYQEAERMAELVAPNLSGGEIERFAVAGVHPFRVNAAGDPVFTDGFRLPTDTSPAQTDLLRERRLGYVIRYTPGSEGTRGVVVEIPDPDNDAFALTLVVLLACLWPLITSILTVWTIVSPVSVIAATFHRIIGRGRTEESDKVPIVYKDEVGRLAFNANRTIDILTEAREKLEQSAQDLAQKNRELKDAYRTKGEFLANMSHELRTPLNAIIGFSRLMKRKLKNSLPERQQKNLDLIQQSGEQLLVLVNDLLDFEKIEAGKLTMRREEVELQPLLSSLESTLQPLAEEKGLRFIVDTQELPPSMICDKDRLRQILANLVTNAIKYSDEGTVSLRVRASGDRLLFEVSDQGIGMTTEQMERIFDPFHQVDGSETRERGGVGLGLAIVGRLVGLLRGNIRVSSVKGKGSTFTVELPLAITTSHLEPRGNGAEILVVDDNLDYLESMHAELTEAGFRVNVAGGGVRALEVLETMTPRAILLDIVMPDLDGWEVLARIRKLPHLRGVPVIITSVVDQKPVGMDLDIAGWLAKPFELESLRDLLPTTGGQGFDLNGRLLVVEDDRQTAQLLEQTFEEVGVKARVAHTEEEARRMLSEALPSVLVLDLNLEQGSGWNVLSFLRGLEGFEETRVYVYTASDLGEKERAELNQKLVTVVHKHGSDSLSELVGSIVGD